MSDRTPARVDFVTNTIRTAESRAPTVAPSAPQPQPSVGMTVLHAAWMSVLLGLVVEAAILVWLAMFNKAPGQATIVAEVAQKVTWSVLVCAGLALGTGAATARKVVTGLMGAVSGPVGFAVAKSAHKSVLAALGATAGAAGSAPLSPIVLASMKGVQYACLGLFAAYLTKRSKAGLRAWVLCGAVVGVVFGGMTVFMLARGASHLGTPMATVDLVAKSINEIAFPMGCSIVLWAATKLARRAG